VNAQDTSAEPRPDLQLEIAHLLLIDVVSYSKLLVNEQIEALENLNQIVRNTECFRAAEASGKLIRVPTGDGMALAFFHSPEEPARCALEISRALRSRDCGTRIQLRMGVHSGPVNRVRDVNDKTNIAGSGINVAQRVMDCGDAGHILLSRHVADDLSEYRHWQPYLHDLGECEVKHGLRVHVFNLYKDGLGKAQLPEKLKQRKGWKQAPGLRQISAPRSPKTVLIAALLVAAIGLVIGSLVFFHRAPAPMARAPAHEAAAMTALAAIPEKSIAVLPFLNLSNEKENAYFADGVQDEILTNLAKVADLKVISRTSVMQYRDAAARNLREIAQELGVAHVLEGSVQRAANRVRVSAQLIDARTDTHLWAEHYDRDLADVFAIQSEIAKTIADQLQAKISPSEKAAIEKVPTTDLVAFDLYERAKALWADVTDPLHAQKNLSEAAQLLNEAVARDPQFLLAWCLLSRVHGALYWTGHDHTQPRLDLANEAVQTALRLQPDAGEAHRALATYYYYGFRDYVRASSELAIARRSLPNDAEIFLYTGLIDRREGRWEKATYNMERALELDPRNLFTLQQLALTYSTQDRYTDAARIYDSALRLVPGDPYTRILRALVELDWRADIKPFQTTLGTVVAENPSAAPDVDTPLYALCERTAAAAARALTNYPRDGVTTEYGVNCPRAYWEGVVARGQGDSAKAQAAFIAARSTVEKILAKQPDFAAAISLLGVIDAGLGRKEDALREGRRACELLPISKDAISGVDLATNLAQIYIWTGEKDRAIEQIAAVERIPNSLSYGLLKLHPYWDPLRGDPRFEKIVASLAPNDAKQ
jgi:TolB-like protein/class 3 adenylate cyclase/Flp pilus assembly protein TadD